MCIRDSITTNSSALTLEGGSIKTGSTNDLANLATNTDALTLASNASFTAVGNFSNTGSLTINKGSTFTLTGTHTLTPVSYTHLIQGAGNQTYLIINGSVTLSGAGTIDLTSTNGQYTNNIYGTGSAPILISSNTIEGAGNLGSGNMGFTNNGTVDANIAGQTLAINVDSTGFTNYNGTNFTLTGGRCV